MASIVSVNFGCLYLLYIFLVSFSVCLVDLLVVFVSYVCVCVCVCVFVCQVPVAY